MGNNSDCLFVGTGSTGGEGKPVLSEEERQEQTKRYIARNSVTFLRVTFHLCTVHKS